MEPAGQGDTGREVSQGASHVRYLAGEVFPGDDVGCAQPGSGRSASCICIEGRHVADAHGDQLRTCLSLHHLGHHRPARHVAVRRPARRRGRHARRCASRPDRRDRPTRNRRRLVGRSRTCRPQLSSPSCAAVRRMGSGLTDSFQRDERTQRSAP